MSARTLYGRMKGTTRTSFAFASKRARVPSLGRLLARMPLTPFFLKTSSACATV